MSEKSYCGMSESTRVSGTEYPIVSYTVIQFPINFVEHWIRIYDRGNYLADRPIFQSSQGSTVLQSYKNACDG